jgi:putative membrane protein
MSRRLALLLVIAPAMLSAHSGEALEPHDLLTAWTFEPGTTIPLVIAALLYAAGARRSRGVTGRQAALFWTGWIVLALALVSPLHELGEVLFSAHMAQHEILMLVAAPLLVLSRPLVPMLWALPLGWRRRTGQWAKARIPHAVWVGITAPVAAWWIHAVALWIWHAPPLFQATLTSEGMHALQHASFFGSALIFWWSLFYARGPEDYGASVLYLFTTAVHTSILGALLTFAPRVWYPAYAQSSLPWGLNPLSDQQIGGLIMWVPAGLVYVAAGLALLAAWLRESEASAERSRYAMQNR